MNVKDTWLRDAFLADNAAGELCDRDLQESVERANW
jgi:hypothetical protein